MLTMRRARKPIRWLPALLAAAALLPATARAQVERRTVVGGTVAIYNLAGKLRVEGWSGSDVTVELTRGGRDASKLRVETGSIRGAETLRVIYPDDDIVYSELGRWGSTTLSVNDDGTFDDDDHHGRDRVRIHGSGSGLEAWADLRVLVPRGKTVRLHLAVGEADIANVEGRISLSVSAASVVASHVRGQLSLDTGSGSVQITDVEGDLDVDTGSGGVTATGIRGDVLHLDTGSGSLRGSDIDVRDLNADVGSGGIQLARVRAPRVKLDAGSGHTELELLAPTEELTVDAGSGGVTIRMPASTGADVDIETGSGGIETDFAVKTTRFERTHVRGTIGDGRGRIRIEAGSGGVRLLKS